MWDHHSQRNGPGWANTSEIGYPPEKSQKALECYFVLLSRKLYYSFYCSFTVFIDSAASAASEKNIYYLKFFNSFVSLLSQSALYS